MVGRGGKTWPFSFSIEDGHVLLELTVPWEEVCEQTFERNNVKYQDLLQDCRGKGWHGCSPLRSAVEDSLQYGECLQLLG